MPLSKPLDRPLLWICLLLVAGALTWWPALDGAFIYDDHHTIGDNPNIRSLSAPGQVFSAPRENPAAGRPVVLLSLALNYAWGEADPAGYHALNLLIHLACGLVLFALVGRALRDLPVPRALRDAATPLAGVTALLWLVHPLTSETVNYVTQRTESLMTLAYLLTLYAALRARGSGRGAWSALAILACALGMGCKESMVTAPVVVVLFDLAYRDRSLAQVWRQRRGLYAGLGATWIFLALLMAQGPRMHSVGFAHGVSAWEYALNQCGVVLEYLRLALWPSPLTIDYGLPRPLTLGDVPLQAGLMLLVLLLVLLTLVRRPRVGALLAAALISLSPTSSFVPIATEVGAERRMYLPLAFLISAAVTLVWHALTHTRARSAARAGAQASAATSAALGLAATALLAVPMAWLSHERSQDYRLERTIWATAVEVHPDNARARNNLGIELALAGELEAATAEFLRAIELRPDYGEAYANLGRALAVAGKLDEALEHFERAIRLQPDYADAYVNLGKTHAMRGDIERAVEQYGLALEHAPDSFDAHYSMGMARAEQGRLSDATGALERAVQLRPDNADARFGLANALAAQGRLKLAAQQLREILARDPEHVAALFRDGQLLAWQGRPEEAVARFRELLVLAPQWLAPKAAASWTLATAGDVSARNVAKAQEVAGLIASVQPAPGVDELEAYAAAAASAGAYDEALQHARAAHEIIALADPFRAELLRRQIQSYERGEPYLHPGENP